MVQTGENAFFLATGCGTVKNTTLALALQSFGHLVQQHDGFLEVASGSADVSLNEGLQRLAAGGTADLFAGDPNLVFEKFHRSLTPELLRKDASSCRLQADALSEICARLLGLMGCRKARS